MPRSMLDDTAIIRCFGYAFAPRLGLSLPMDFNTVALPLGPRPAQKLEWRSDVDPCAWDSTLAALGGHPLQSAFWGDARLEVDGIRDHRWMAVLNGVPVWMIRVEERRIPGVGWVGWAPRGPTGESPMGIDLTRVVADRFANAGMRLLITDPWRRYDGVDSDSRVGVRPRTIWVDIGVGQDKLWDAFDKRIRNGVRRAENAGVTVDVVRTPDEIENFFSLCVRISQVKGFRLPGSLPMMILILAGVSGSDVEAVLLVARHEGRLAAGALIMRCGRSIHYFWGGTDRNLSIGAGEAVHWAAMKWAVERQCTIYDLEGIDPTANHGTYAFKKKMGGQEVELMGKHYFPAGLRGQVVAWIDARRHRYS